MIERGVNENFDEERFEELLESSLEELPPDSIVPDISPWHKAMNRVVLGTALNLLRLNILWLNYILPTIGMIMLILGLRRLRRENGGFMACYVLTILRAAMDFPALVLNATRFHSQIYALPCMTAATWISFIIQAAYILCLSWALNAVHRKAGLSGTVRGVRSLVVWFIIMLVLALVNYNGVIIGWIVILSFFPIVYSLSKIAGELSEAGYCVRCAGVRVSDRALTLTVLGVLAAAIAFCYIFLAGYPMDWQPAPARRSEQAGAMCARLAELGYPEELLADLTDEDILACEGAVRVVVDAEDRRNFHDCDGEILVRGVMVQTGDITQWRVFHHFLWLEGDFHATEAVRIWISGDGEEARFLPDSLGGQLLYERDGGTYAAPYYSLSSGTQTTYSMFGMYAPITYNRISAAFTLPNRAENQRGYVCYDYEQLLYTERFYISIWLDYTHQYNWWIYPVVTAEGFRQSGRFDNYHFDTVQSAIQLDAVRSPELFGLD